jgi:hypothetical protein
MNAPKQTGLATVARHADSAGRWAVTIDGQAVQYRQSRESARRYVRAHNASQAVAA